MTDRAARLLELAHWPKEPYDRPQDYIDVLLGELLKGHPRLLLEASITQAMPDLGEFECIARLASGTFGAPIRDGKATVESIGNGTTPGAAYINAALHAIRSATLGPHVPVLGRLLSKGRLQVDMAALEGQEGDPYVLRVSENHRHFHEAFDMAPPQFPANHYDLEARIRISDPTKRTDYVVITNLDAPENAAIKEAVAPYMYLGSAIYGHRLLLALGARAVNDMKSHNEVRASLRLEPYEDDRRHGHHHNGDGLDNRQANLTPLTPTEHARRHSSWAADYGDIARSDESIRIVHLAPQVITATSHFESLEISDHLDVVSLSRLDQPNAATLHALDDRPVTLAEIESFAGKKPSPRNVRLALSALKSLGGQGRSSAILSARSVSRVSENTVRNALRRLEDAHIIACTRIESLGETGYGAEKHYRLLRPLGSDVLRLMRHKPKQAN